MTQKELFGQIKNRNLKKIYLLHGQEEFAKEIAISKLKGFLESDFIDFNLSALDSPSAEALISECEALPLMDERRMIFAKNTELYQKAPEQAKKMTEYLKNICPTTCLIFIEQGECDKRLSLFKSIDDRGGCVDFEMYSEVQAAEYAASVAKKRGINLSRDLALKLVMMCGRSLREVDGQAQRIIDFAGDREITSQMMDSIVRKNLEYTVFELFDSFTVGNMAKGMQILNATLFDEGSGSGIKMIGFLASRIRGMLQARIYIDMGKDDKQAAQMLGGHPFAAKKTVEGAKRFKTKKLEDALLLLGDADYNIKRSLEKEDEAIRRAVCEIFG